MVNVLNKQILDKVKEIINYIEESDNYQKYLLIKDKLKDDEEINSLLEEIKRLQKILANNKNDKVIEESLKIKNKELNDIPLYRDYLNILDGQMSGQRSRGSVGAYQADERAGVAGLSWRLLGR